LPVRSRRRKGGNVQRGKKRTHFERERKGRKTTRRKRVAPENKREEEKKVFLLPVPPIKKTPPNSRKGKKIYTQKKRKKIEQQNTLLDVLGRERKEEVEIGGPGRKEKKKFALPPGGDLWEKRKVKSRRENGGAARVCHPRKKKGKKSHVHREPTGSGGEKNGRCPPCQEEKKRIEVTQGKQREENAQLASSRETQ